MNEISHEIQFDVFESTVDANYMSARVLEVFLSSFVVYRDYDLFV